MVARVECFEYCRAKKRVVLCRSKKKGYPCIADFNDHLDGIEFLGDESQALGHVAREPVDDFVVDKCLPDIQWVHGRLVVGNAGAGKVWEGWSVNAFLH